MVLFQIQILRYIYLEVLGIYKVETTSSNNLSELLISTL